MAPSARTFNGSTRYKQNCRHKKHIHTNHEASTDQDSRYNHEIHRNFTSRDAKSTQHTKTTHPYNVSLKLSFPKVTSFHPHYLTYILQTYHQPEYRLRSCLIQMTTITYTHRSTSAAKKYIQPYIRTVISGQEIVEEWYRNQ